MSFNKEDPKVPVAIGDISIVLTDYSGEDSRTAQFQVQILQEDGSLFRLLQGDLIPHMTPAQKTWVTKFVAQLRAKAEEEIL